MKYLLGILGLLLLVSCSETDKENNLKKDFDRTGRPQTITVMVYDNKREMQKAKADATNRQEINTDLLGWSIWSPNKESYGCTIHVMELKNSNDTDQMVTWGHELGHCMYGTYHPEID